MSEVQSTQLCVMFSWAPCVSL